MNSTSLDPSQNKERGKSKRKKIPFYLSQLLVFFTYLSTGQLGLSLGAVHHLATLVWPPTGISIAVLALAGYSFWPSIFLGALVVNLSVGAPFPVAFGIAVGNTFEGLLGAYFMRWARIHPSFNKLQDVLKFVLFTVILSTLVSSSIGLLSLWIGVGEFKREMYAYSDIFTAWWFGDITGALVIAPLILVWHKHFPLKLPKSFNIYRIIEASVLLFSTLFVCSIAFQSPSFSNLIYLNHPYFIFPILIWTAVRFGQEGSVIITFLISAFAVWGTAKGSGPFVSYSLSAGLMRVQTFMSMTTLTSLVLSASLEEREQNKKQLTRMLHEGEQNRLLLLTYTHRLKAQHDCMRVLSSSRSVNETARQILQIIGTYLEWDFGAFWILDKNKQFLHTLEVWCTSNLRSSDFMKETLRFKFRPGQGLPGRVLTSGSPTWIEDIIKDENFPRFEFAEKDGLHAAFAFPVFNENKILGVIEFFNKSICAPDETLLATVASIGGQIGQFLERTKTEESLQEAYNELEKKVAQRTEALFRSRQLLIEAERLAHLGCWEWDVATNSVSWSDELYRIYGLRPDQFDGSLDSFFNLIHPEDRESVRKIIYHSYSTGEQFSIRERIIRPDQSVRILQSFGIVTKDALGNSIRMYGACQDITELRVLWKEFEKGEKRFQAMVEGLKDYAIYMLDRHGYIESWNEGAKRIKGYEEQEIIGKPYSVFYIPEDLKKHRPELNLRLAEKNGHFEEEGWRVRKDGSRFWAHVLITPIQDSEGHLLGFSKVTQDRTQLKKAEEEKENLLEREKLARNSAEKAARMRDEMVAIVSHDLKSPLTGILAGIDFILQMKWYDERAKRQLELIARAANNMNRMIGEWLDIYKSEAGGYKAKVERNHEPYNVLDLVKEAVELQKNISNQKNIHFNIDIPPELPLININIGLVEQLFQNILGNAIKFSGEGSTIFLSAKRMNTEIVFSVRDTGDGIEEDLLPTLFDRFIQAKNTSRLGTGLGLVIAKGIVEAHGGKIWVESSRGLGTIFFFSLPVDYSKSLKAVSQ